MEDLKQFRVLKARKAAFGFTTTVQTVHSFVVAGEAVKFLSAYPPHKYTIEINAGGYSMDFKVYTDDPTIADAFNKEFACFR